MRALIMTIQAHPSCHHDIQTVIREHESASIITANCWILKQIVSLFTLHSSQDQSLELPLGASSHVQGVVPWTFPWLGPWLAINKWCLERIEIMGTLTNIRVIHHTD